jgi:hypothetical protein
MGNKIAAIELSMRSCLMGSPVHGSADVDKAAVVYGHNPVAAKRGSRAKIMNFDEATSG